MLNQQCESTNRSTLNNGTVCHVKRISYNAIIIGALVGVGLGYLLNLFSIAIGLSILTTPESGSVTVAVGGFIGLLIGSIAAMFVSGFTAGFLGRGFAGTCHLGVLYGFSTWCLSLILMVILSSSILNYVAHYSAFISNPTSVTLTDKEVVAAPKASVANENDLMPKSISDLTVGSFLVFVLFFVGALSSCIGGHCGMSCCKKEYDEKH